MYCREASVPNPELGLACPIFLPTLDRLLPTFLFMWRISITGLEAASQPKMRSLFAGWRKGLGCTLRSARSTFARPLNLWAVGLRRSPARFDTTSCWKLRAKQDVIELPWDTQ